MEWMIFSMAISFFEILRIKIGENNIKPARLRNFKGQQELRFKMFDKLKYLILTDGIEDVCLIEAIRHLWLFADDQDVTHLKATKRFINLVMKRCPQKKLSSSEKYQLEQERECTKSLDEINDLCEENFEIS